MYPRRPISDRELRLHNDHVNEARNREAREHGYNSWAEYIEAQETEKAEKENNR